jgi:hypothetical protein
MELKFSSNRQNILAVACWVIMKNILAI